MNRTNIKSLMTQKEELDSLEIDLATKTTEFELANLSLSNQITKTKSEITRLTDLLKEEALIEFEKFGLKKLEGGIGIRSKSSFSYDAKEAFEWAKKSGTCLVLDKKTFDKVGASLVTFGETKVENTVTFPKKLVLTEEVI